MTQQQLLPFDIHQLHGLLVHAKAHLHSENSNEATLAAQLQRVIKDWPWIGRVTVAGAEELNTLRPHPNQVWVDVCPIDGLLNYRNRDGTLGDPYLTVVTVIRNVANATFNDVLLAGMIDLRPASKDSKDIWLAWKDANDRIHGTLNGKPLKTLPAPHFDSAGNVIMVDLSKRSNRDALGRLITSDISVNARVTGSKAYDMAQVASGKSILFLDNCLPAGIGAGYLLTKAAGGEALDWTGSSLANLPYKGAGKTPVILAASIGVATDALGSIHGTIPYQP